MENKIRMLELKGFLKCINRGKLLNRYTEIEGKKNIKKKKESNYHE